MSSAFRYFKALETKGLRQIINFFPGLFFIQNDYKRRHNCSCVEKSDVNIFLELVRFLYRSKMNQVRILRKYTLFF